MLFIYSTVLYSIHFPLANERSNAFLVLLVEIGMNGKLEAEKEWARMKLIQKSADLTRRRACADAKWYRIQVDKINNNELGNYLALINWNGVMTLNSCKSGRYIKCAMTTNRLFDNLLTVYVGEFELIYITSVGYLNLYSFILLIKY